MGIGNINYETDGNDKREWYTRIKYLSYLRRAK